MTGHPETDPDFVPGFGPVPGSGFDADPFGPEAYKTHRASCSCPDCVAEAAELYRDPDVDECEHYRDPRTCEGCAAEELAFRRTRQRAARMVTGAEQALAALASLRTLLDETTAIDPVYREWYSDGDADTDATLDLEDAARSVRAFARIARERAARTEQHP